MQKLKHLIEAGALTFVFAVFRAMPLDMASAIGGFIGRAVGPFMSAHKTAAKNLSMVFPTLSEPEKRKLLRDMWDNLGRNAAELPHLPSKKLLRRIQVYGMENLPGGGKPVIFFSGHLGNWELLSVAASSQGLPLTLIYRQANNPYADKIISSIRATYAADMLPKGFKGAGKLVRTIKNGQSMAMLIDQKMNEGIAVPFFGRDAMTAPAIAEFALRFDMPIIPARIVRTKGCRFEGTMFPPLGYEKTGDDEKDVLTIMTKINVILESWIREYPAQWFWVHNRWPKS